MCVCVCVLTLFNYFLFFDSVCCYHLMVNKDVYIAYKRGIAVGRCPSVCLSDTLV